jgi:predicted N-acetyltransferase YhbS
MRMIREANVDDIPAIQSLMQSVPGFWDKAWREDVLQLALRCASGLALVMEQEGKIVGFVCAHDVGFRGYLSALVVGAAVRGQGIGSELLGGVEAALSSRGCTVLISDVWRDAEVFYRHLGWSQPDVVLLRKKLA